MNDLASEPIHASCVAINGAAILITGRSGAGKSDLALRLIDRGAALVSDDYTQLDRRDGQLVASPPATIRGKIEMHGVGIIDMPHLEDIPVVLVIAIDEPPERMPSGNSERLIAGVRVPQIALAGLEASAPLKAEWALRQVLAR